MRAFDFDASWSISEPRVAHRFRSIKREMPGAGCRLMMLQSCRNSAGTVNASASVVNSVPFDSSLRDLLLTLSILKMRR